MLLITYYSPVGESYDEPFPADRVLKWKVGDPPPSEAQTLKTITLRSIQAEGPEGLHIFTKFHGIPFYGNPYNSLNTWTGQWAEFIFTHLGT